MFTSYVHRSSTRTFSNPTHWARQPHFACYKSFRCPVTVSIWSTGPRMAKTVRLLHTKPPREAAQDGVGGWGV